MYPWLQELDLNYEYIDIPEIYLDLSRGPMSAVNDSKKSQFE